MRRLLIVSLALIAFASSLAAQSKHPFTFEDMMKLKRVNEPVPSPDGKWIVFSAVDVDLAANTKTPHIWIVPADGSAKERRLPVPGLRQLEECCVPSSIYRATARRLP